MSGVDGSGFSYLPVHCGRDLTRNGGQRYFISSYFDGTVFPDGSANTQLFVTDEDCTTATKISNEPWIGFHSWPIWSPDGTKIATIAYRYIEPEVYEAGIYVCDVVFDSTGRPIGIANLHEVFRMPDFSTIDWASDNRRIAFAKWVVSEDGEHRQRDIFVGDTLTGESVNVTNTPDVSEDTPAWHPTEDRIAFTRDIPTKSGIRKDIFSIPGSGGAVTRLTTKNMTGQNWNREPGYSPDGRELVFAAGSGIGFFDHAIYKISLDGTGKAVKLTGRNSGDFRNPRWRR